ncbi:hypothetical protein RB595_009747 [Gaeumannomyces hyphopodioides]
MPCQRNTRSLQQRLGLVSSVAIGKEPGPPQQLQAPAALGRRETLNWMRSRTAGERESASRQLGARIAEAEVRIHAGRQSELTQCLETQVSPGPKDLPPILPEFTPEAGFESLSRMVLSDPVFQGALSGIVRETSTEPAAEPLPASPRTAHSAALYPQGLERCGGVPAKPSPASPTAPSAAPCPRGLGRRGVAPILDAIRPRRAQPAAAKPPPPPTCRCGPEKNRRLASELASYLSIPGCVGADDVLLHVLEHPRTRQSLARLYPQAAARFNSISWGEALSGAARGCPKRCCGAGPRLLPGWVRAICRFPCAHMVEARQIIQRRTSLFPTEANKGRKLRVAGKAKGWEAPSNRYHLAGVAGVFDAGTVLRKNSRVSKDGIRLGLSRSHRKAVARVRKWTPPSRSPLCIS